MIIRDVGWDHPDAQRLCEAQQAELTQIYGESDIEPFLPADEIVAMYVGYVDGEAACCGALRRRDGEVGELKRMYTVPAYRSRGLARAVLGALEARALAEGFSQLALETGIRQPHAMALYERAGYRRIENFGPYKDEPDSRCYGKELSTESVQRALGERG